MQKLSLTRFELFKLFSRKSVWILFGLMVFVVYLPLQLTASNTNNNPGYYLQTPPTAQQLKQAEARLQREWAALKQVEGDRSQLTTANSANKKLQSELARDQAIVDSSRGRFRSTLNELQAAVVHLKAQGHTGFAYRMYNLEYSMISHLPYIGAGYFIGGPALAVEFFQRIGFVMFGAMVMFGLSFVFAEEYAIGTDSFLLTTKRGRREITTAKLWASLLYVCVMGCIMSVANLATNLTLFGVKGLSFPLQSIAMFASSPFHFSVWQFILAATLIQMFGGIAFGFVVLLISSFTRVPLVPFFVSIGVLVMPYLIVKSFPGAVWAHAVMQFSYTAVIEVWGLFTGFVAYNLFGFPVLYPIIVIALAVLICVPFVWLTYFAVSKRQIAS